MLSVSPPLKGLASDSKIEKDFRNTSADSKSEFEKTLKAKLDLKQSEKNKPKVESKDGDKAKVARNEDAGSKTEKKDKKSSGGIKKKMTDDENDTTMVSNIMASQESEIEIPESKTDLAEIEVGIENQQFKPVEALGAEKGVLTVDVNLADQTQMTDVFQMDADVQPNAEIAKSAAETAQPEIAPALIALPNVQLQQTEVPQQKTNAQLEQELGEEVGFQSDLNRQVGSDLVQKMKSFEAEKNLTTDKAQAFELAVLDQLKKQIPAGEAPQQDSGQSDSKDSSKDLKSDIIKAEGMLHAGQAHTEFKANLATSIDKTSDLQASKLEESHDKNIKELMSQARYLVTKGGGEMKISMSPEGMGEVQLKVMLQDGKVNVEIQTQDKSVKKMIEDSLTELKSGLAAHRLSVEHVRIDTVNATNTENSAQNYQGQSEGKQREFWNSFQQNLGQKNSGRTTYQGSVTGSASTASAGINGSASNSSALRTYGGTKGATINRVA